MSTCCSGSTLSRFAAKDGAISNSSSTNASGWLEVVVEVDVDVADDDDDDDEATGETDCAGTMTGGDASGALGSSTSTTCTLDCTECCKRSEHELE